MPFMTQQTQEQAKRTAAPAVRLFFDRSEFGARIAKTRQAMQKAGIDLLVVSDPTNMGWLTGYDGWSFYVHQCVLLPLEGGPACVAGGQDANGAKRTVMNQHGTHVEHPDRDGR